MRRRSLPLGTQLWRIDAAVPHGWQWAGFGKPRFRFDPSSGGFRTRYAATSIAGAAREKYVDPGRLIPADHAGHHLVRLVTTKAFRVLDLRTQANLDALRVDDRINTSHEPAVWRACQRLADAARSWWDDLDAIVYRSRTTPQDAVNVAFFSLDGLAVEASPTLRGCRSDLDGLVLHHHFTIGFTY